MRTLLVVLIVAATASFVVGVGIERGKQSHHVESGEVAPQGTEQSGEPDEDHTEGVEGGTERAEQSEELRPFGIDVEAWPFVAAAALASLALAVAVWLRPRRSPLLAAVGLVMLAFALLDVREVFHQADTGETGLAILATVIAALHLAAAAVAGRMATAMRGSSVPAAGPAGSMRA